MTRFAVKVLVFLFIKLPILIVTGLIKLLVFPLRLLSLLARVVGLLKYLAIAAVLWNVGKLLLDSLERHGERQPAT
jgi:hypothetical protein